MLRSALFSAGNFIQSVAGLSRAAARLPRRRKQVSAVLIPRDSGFTLMELLVVMGIIAMLASVSYPIYSGIMHKARVTTAKAQISSLSQALELYALDVGTFPPQQVGLSGLLQSPTNTPSWRGPYLKKADGLTDPWGRPYNYKFPGTKGQPEVFTLATDTLPALTSD
jgi:general secretion pathway protein G